MSTPQSPFNPSRQVERIREVLVGRQMARLEQRVDRLERTQPASRPVPPTAAATHDDPRVDQRFDQFRAHFQAQTQVLATEIGRIEQRLGQVEQQQSSPPPPPAPPPPDRRVDELESALAHQAQTMALHLAAEAKQRRDETAALAARIQQTAETFQQRIAEVRAPQADPQLAALRDEFHAETTALRRKVEGEVLRRAEDLRELTARIEQIAQRPDSQSALPSLHAIEQRLASWLQQWQDQLARYLQGREQQLIGHLREELLRMRETTARALTDIDSRKADRAEMHDRMARVSAVARALAEAGYPAGT